MPTPNQAIETIESLAKRVKTRFKQYEEIPDRELVSLVISKHPEYQNRLNVEALKDLVGGPQLPSKSTRLKDLAKTVGEGLVLFPSEVAAAAVSPPPPEALASALPPGLNPLGFGGTLPERVVSRVFGPQKERQLRSIEESVAAGRMSEAYGKTAASMALPFSGDAAIAAGEALGRGDLITGPALGVLAALPGVSTARMVRRPPVAAPRPTPAVVPRPAPLPELARLEQARAVNVRPAQGMAKVEQAAAAAAPQPPPTAAARPRFRSASRAEVARPVSPEQIRQTLKNEQAELLRRKHASAGRPPAEIEALDARIVQNAEMLEGLEGPKPQPTAPQAAPARTAPIASQAPSRPSPAPRATVQPVVKQPPPAPAPVTSALPEPLRRGLFQAANTKRVLERPDLTPEQRAGYQGRLQQLQTESKAAFNDWAARMTPEQRQEAIRLQSETESRAAKQATEIRRVLEQTKTAKEMRAVMATGQPARSPAGGIQIIGTEAGRDLRDVFHRSLGDQVEVAFDEIAIGQRAKAREAGFDPDRPVPPEGHRTVPKEEGGFRRITPEEWQTVRGEAQKQLDTLKTEMQQRLETLKREKLEQEVAAKELDPDLDVEALAAQAERNSIRELLAEKDAEGRSFKQRIDDLREMVGRDPQRPLFVRKGRPVVEEGVVKAPGAVGELTLELARQITGKKLKRIPTPEEFEAYAGQLDTQAKQAKFFREQLERTAARREAQRGGVGEKDPFAPKLARNKLYETAAFGRLTTKSILDVLPELVETAKDFDVPVSKFDDVKKPVSGWLTPDGQHWLDASYGTDSHYEVINRFTIGRSYHDAIQTGSKADVLTATRALTRAFDAGFVRKAYEDAYEIGPITESALDAISASVRKDLDSGALKPSSHEFIGVSAWPQGWNKGKEVHVSVPVKDLVEGASFREVYGQRLRRARLFSSERGAVGEGPKGQRDRPSPNNALFYSTLERTLETKMPAQADARQVANLLSSQGVPKVEVDWSGIREYLDTAQREGRKVSRDEVLRRVRENTPRVEVKELGEAAARTDLSAVDRELLDRYERTSSEVDNAYVAYENEFAQALRQQGIDPINAGVAGEMLRDLVEGTEFIDRSSAKYAKVKALSETPPWRERLEALQEKVTWIREKYDEIAALRGEAASVPAEEWSGPRFEQYTLPGGTNYREVLLKLPELTREAQRVMDNPRTSAEEIGRATNAQYNQTFRSGHFDEPNVVAHLRLKDRIGPQGERVLFIEEVQSDWAKAVRAERENIGHRLEPIFRALEMAQHVERQGFPTAALPQYTLAAEQLGNVGTSVPSMPFAEGSRWMELAVKYALREAAEKGYDAVAWTTGRQNAGHYNLRQVSDELSYNLTHDGLYRIALRKNGQTIPGSLQDVTAEKLPSFIGRELADRVIKTATHNDASNSGIQRIAGVELETGGEHHLALYDHMLPNFVNNYTKKWKGRVEPFQIASVKPFTYSDPIDPVAGMRVDKPTSLTVHALRITPEMRSSLGKPQPLFGSQRGIGGVEITGGMALGGIAGGLAAGVPGAAIGTILGGLSPIALRKLGPAARSVVRAFGNDPRLSQHLATGRLQLDASPRDISFYNRYLGSISTWYSNERIGRKLPPAARELAKRVTVADETITKTAWADKTEFVQAAKDISESEWQSAVVPALKDSTLYLSLTPELQQVADTARSLLDRGRIGLRDSLREALVADGYTAKSAAKAVPDDWGIEENYFPIIQRGNWRILRETAGGKGWEPVETGWRQITRSKAEQVALDYLEANPGSKVRVTRETGAPQPTNATPQARLKHLLEDLRKVQKTGQGLDDAVDKAAAGAYGPQRTPPRRFSATQRRERNLPGGLESRADFEQFLNEQARAIELIKQRPKLMRLRNALAGQLGGDAPAAGPAQLPRRTGWKMLGRIDRAIEGLEGYPNAFEAQARHAFEVMGLNPRSADIVQARITEVWAMTKLGYNPASAMINLFQLAHNGFVARELGPKGLTLGIDGLLRQRKKFQPVLDELNIRRKLDKMNIDDFESYAGAGWKGFRNSALWLFSESEFANQAVTVVGAYRKATAAGLKHAEAIDFARRANLRINFDYSRFDLPPVLMDLPRPVVQFKPFAFKQLEFVLGLRGPGEIGRFLAMTGMLGILTLPFVELADDTIEAATGVSPLGKLRTSGNKAAELMLRGLPGQAGVDVTRNIGFTEAFRPKLDNLLGPFLSDMNRLAKASPALAHDYFGSPAGSREHERAKNEFFQRLSPEARRIFERMRDGDVLRDPRSGDVIMRGLTPKEQVAMASGLQPVRVSREQDRQREVQSALTRHRDRRGYIVDQLAQQLLKLSDGKLSADKKREAQRQFNAVMREAVKQGPTILSGLEEAVQERMERAMLERAMRDIKQAPLSMRPEVIEMYMRQRKLETPAQPE